MKRLSVLSIMATRFPGATASARQAMQRVLTVTAERLTTPLVRLGRTGASRALLRMTGKVFVTGSILDQYMRTVPSYQNALDIFAGEWASRLPPPMDGVLHAGSAPLFQDVRISWADERIGGFEGKTVLELGPLEGAHTYMMERLGASAITAIEGNTRAFLKCLIIKEILRLHRVLFLCGDFLEYLRTNEQQFDVAVANGVLYHMESPVELLALLARASDRVLLWTVYFDPDVLRRSPHIMRRFAGSTSASFEDFSWTQFRYEYREAQLVEGYCGGSRGHSYWLTRDTILEALRHFGLTDIEIGFDVPDHPSGPAMTIIARRPPALPIVKTPASR